MEKDFESLYNKRVHIWYVQTLVVEASGSPTPEGDTITSESYAGLEGVITAETPNFIYLADVTFKVVRRSTTDHRQDYYVIPKSIVAGISPD